MLAIAFSCGFALAQEQPAARAIAAYVGDDTISVAEVEHEVAGAAQDREMGDVERNNLQAQTLGLLINRQLVLQFLAKHKLGASASDIDQSVEEMKKKLAAKEVPLADYLRDLNITEAEMRRSMQWTIGWPKYLNLQFTEKNLQKYFDANKRDFDGTQLRVRHILWKIPADATPDLINATAKKAEAVYDEIKAGKITFIDAAKKHSEGATAAEGGDLGLISRQEPMPAPFNDAAYSLKPGEYSRPVVTPFGVHLILCEQEVPGKKTLSDGEVEQLVRDELRRYLFTLIAAQGRADIAIRFTGELPYFDPQTNQLVVKKAKPTPSLE